VLPAAQWGYAPSRDAGARKPLLLT